MNYENQIKELRDVEESIENYGNKIAFLQEKKSKFIKNISYGITFNIADLSECIALLINLVENRAFVPVSSNLDHELVYNYCILVDDNNNNNKYSVKKNNLCNNDDTVVIYDSKSNKGKINYRLTYQFILDKFNIDKKYYKGHVDKSDFDNRPYIKEFICLLAENQLNRQTRFRYHDMTQYLMEYLTINKTFKTRELSKNK